MDDTALVQRAREGDDAAFARLVEAYQSQVFNLAYRMLRQRQEAEDAAQETFLRAFRQLSTYKPDQRFRSWLLAIAAHYCVDQLRRRRFLWLSLEDVPIIGSLVSHEPQPESAALAAEQRDEVAMLLNCLPPRYRLVTVLRYNYDLPTAEIAAIVGSTDGAVKTQLCRARDMLAAEIRKQTPTNDGRANSLALDAPSGAAAYTSHARGLGLEVNKEDVTDALRRPRATDIAIGR
ncbi:MAG: sigma-70 family RNA polymerase sigma factor [Chloroflexota bacterium]|nr:sigma-70 family RNA polymerase sigma factor [Chloroflexota bacterium]